MHYDAPTSLETAHNNQEKTCQSPLIAKGRDHPWSNRLLYTAQAI